MGSKYRVPLTFNEKKLYESWKNEVTVWIRVTDQMKKKQAHAVVLALLGKVREMLKIPVDDLNKDTGIKKLLRQLNDLFLKEENDRAFEGL